MGFGNWIKKAAKFAVKTIDDNVVDIVDSDSEWVNEARCEEDEIQEESVRGSMLGLYRDQEFSAQRPDKILGGDLYDPNIEWLRPHEICDDPKFYSSGDNEDEAGGSQFDVVQGSLGDCWMLAAMAILSQNEDMLHRVAPPQSFDPDEGYDGKFTFTFWQYGKWKTVIIDDRLPTRNGRLIFTQSSTKNEFWTALLEKAYAKMHGNYKALEGGHGSEAMTDFTGGICDYIEWKKGECDAQEQYEVICDAIRDSALITTAIQAQSKADMERKRGDGLIVGHAYSITGAGVYNGADGRRYHLLKLRNPWGACEWTGDFSDASGRWDEYDMEPADNGEFYISCQDWARHFTKIEVCRVDPEDFDTEGDWVNESKRLSWNDSDGTAGGCRNFDTFCNNPYTVVHLDGGHYSDQILISLQQIYKRSDRQQGKNMLPIGFEVYKVDEDSGDLAAMIDGNDPIFSATFVARRDYTKSLRMAKYGGGSYLVVPSTFRPGQESDFHLRIFTEHSPDKQRSEDCDGDDDGWW